MTLVALAALSSLGPLPPELRALTATASASGPSEVSAEQAPDVRVATVSLVTVGPGDTPVSSFGHSLILFEGPAADTTAFSFGQSDYGQLGLLVRALQGSVQAGAGEIAWTSTREAYLAAGRTIWIQRLALRPDEVAALRAELVRSSGFFAYSTFDENCTTTLRDALDRALGGRIQAQTAEVPTSESLRDHILPLVRPHPLLASLSALALTDRIDGPASVWEAMFLPETLRSGLREVTVSAEGRSEAPLVIREDRLGPSPVELSSAGLPYWLSALLVGTGLGSALAILGRRARRSGPAGRAFTFLAAGWALAAGLIGLLLVLVGLSPDPALSVLNENLWHLNPGFLGVAIMAWGSHPDRPAARRLALLLALSSVAGVLLEGLAAFDQANLAVAAFALPANLGLALGLSMWTGTASRIDPLRLSGGLPSRTL